MTFADYDCIMRDIVLLALGINLKIIACPVAIEKSHPADHVKYMNFLSE
jgi:hypothetical protein